MSNLSMVIPSKLVSNQLPSIYPTSSRILYTHVSNFKAQPLSSNQVIMSQKADSISDTILYCTEVSPRIEESLPSTKLSYVVVLGTDMISVVVVITFTVRDL
jgi:hypothetical protein